ncbi:MAG TPA: hypothetical protein ENK02_15210 [Planctomycetes bacterium]|nr:hypothetical protein [Planctomycetota bacterium]
MKRERKKRPGVPRKGAPGKSPQKRCIRKEEIFARIPDQEPRRLRNKVDHSKTFREKKKMDTAKTMILSEKMPKDRTRDPRVFSTCSSGNRNASRKKNR